MAIVTFKQAGLLSGKGTATIYRHIKSGKLSKTGSGVDTSELIRVYGELKAVDTNDNYQIDKKSDIIDNMIISNYQKQIDILHEIVNELKNDKQILTSVIEDYRRLLPSPSSSEAVQNTSRGINSGKLWKRIFKK
jgi:hypothetical protein